MTVFNVVRFKLKPGTEETFLAAHRNIGGDWQGLRHANIIKTGEGHFCIIAEWDSMEALAAMIPVLAMALPPASLNVTLQPAGRVILAKLLSVLALRS